jgi:predicted O-linked N-acetylglucosamine transferase (SPINDLY family)
LELKPDCAQALSNLGNALKDRGELDEAVACYRRALELEPDFSEAHNNLGITLKDLGRLEEAIACWRRALNLKPDFAEAHSNLLLGLQYCTGVTPAALAEAHAEYDRRHAAALRGAIVPHAGVRDSQGRRRVGLLRLGFVSPDLGQHPVGCFLVRVLENLDREQVETVCYSDRAVKDDLTHRLQAAATQWRDVIGLSHQRLAEQIRADRIDVLFDLAGHTGHNRLLVFARKPAPIQVTWAGYVGTTGLEAMDYLLADRYEVPPAAEGHYRERVLRMPDDYVCYDPPRYAPSVGPLPALERGQLTLGCFNNPAKITPQAIEVWAKILHRLPGARLVLKFKGWDNGGVARRYAEMFATQAIDPGRVELLGSSPHAALLAEYNRIDLALDPFPYSGGLTTCEALWMGVPVVTCPGETFAGRHSLSHLSNVGLTETIAQALEEYVELAVSLAGDLPRLAALRAGLRERMAASPLCDGKRFAANFMALMLNL